MTDMESELVGLLMGSEVREVLSELVDHDAYGMNRWRKDLRNYENVDPPKVS